jgi:DNA-binding NtrC family response regulator
MKFGDDERFGLRIIAQLKALAPEVPILVVSGLDQFEVREGETLRRACERIHAEDFLAAPGTSADVVPAEYRASGENLQRRLLEVGLIPDPAQEVVGYSLAVCRMLRSLRQLIPDHLVGEILLRGEPGSGKSHLMGYAQREIARRLHKPESQVRAERVSLSGLGLDHQKMTLLGIAGGTNIPPGPGVFERLEGGLVFLDEIGEVHPGAQADLLPILQPLREPQGRLYRPVTRMGANEAFHSHTFVIAATNKDLEALVAQGQFSDALLQRFAYKEIHVPPLRDRIADLPTLITHFVQAKCRELGLTHLPELEVPQEVWIHYAQHHSVRELQNLIASAITQHRRKTLLTEQDLFPSGKEGALRIPIGIGFSAQEPQPLKVVQDPASVAALVASIDNWRPAAPAPAEDYRGALPQIDRAIGRAKLRLLREFLKQQQQINQRPSVDLKAAIRVLLGNDRIANTKSGDVAHQLFKAAGVVEPPDDPILVQAWEKRRDSRKRKKGPE